MVWRLLVSVLLLLSSIATFLTMLHLRCRWDVRVSCVRWLFWLFFFYVWLWTSLRTAYFLWLTTASESIVARDGLGLSDTNIHIEDFDLLYAVLHLRETKTTWLVVVFCAGDLALLGFATTLFPLVFELGRIAQLLMDRGSEQERLQSKRYAVWIHAFLLSFGIVEVGVAAAHGGYTKETQHCLVFVYIVQFIGLAYMIGCMILLRWKGRQLETIQGAFVSSPVYQRLKRIMLVYVVFCFQFQLSSVIVYIANPSVYVGVLKFIGVSRLMYSASGLALSVTTSCSQECVLAVCSCCIPKDLESQTSRPHLDRLVTAPTDEDLAAPSTDPVFVFTDIESSSALWGIGDGQMMEQATEIHDNILRSTLPKYRGYEITTCGDAFQLSFHKIRDAIEYCLDVQLQLLAAKWPTDLHGAVPATRREYHGRRRLFNGLRVRMGIHDASDVDGKLIKGIHATTGKTIYTGASEATAQFVGDLGYGGQILLTGRVAAWLKYRLDDLSVQVAVDRVGMYTVLQLNTTVDIFHVQPQILAERLCFFPPPDRRQVNVEHPQRPTRCNSAYRVEEVDSPSDNIPFVAMA
ncbi:hypothetical protein Poli38472_013737 [Pythium oligandrum]|uniref:Guanylate cyclase domain-containing protein n=1 Tax=Pythium oligandrum TaxID=41045 RepID=A0A8K1FHR0_PYTOL|nr:hypothetical protein Poli38472_013737 [Pythium oligandrum]|eukprot:TMW61274.1 hypothetical protein Poli38472_013737 [Pythium oligandrum]